MSAAVIPTGRAAALDRVIEGIQKRGRPGLMAHLVVGYPTIGASRQIAQALLRSGVDILEVQIPFSDPTADGPTITLACHKALELGARVADAMRLVEEITRQSDVPVVVMSYANLLCSYRAVPAGQLVSSGQAGPGGERGIEHFTRDAARAGAAGLIVPDLPPEETQEGYPEACRRHGLHPIHVVSPNIGDDRLRAVASVAGGFLYSTSRTGTTGKEMEIAMTELSAFLGRARTICGLPIAVGFSISKREQIEAFRGIAEIAVVGSHFIRVHDRVGLAGLEREARVLAGRKD